LGRLDAVEETTGKLRWSQKIPMLAEAPNVNQRQPMWLTTGIQATDRRLLVWGNGTAVLEADTGALLWKASVAAAPIFFPLELEHGMAAPAAQTYMSGGQVLPNSYRRGVFSRIQFTSSLAIPSYGFPGMYGSAQADPWLLWGGEGDRYLHGDGLWLLGQNTASARYSVLGFPQHSNAGLRYLSLPWHLCSARPVAPWSWLLKMVRTACCQMALCAHWRL